MFGILNFGYWDLFVICDLLFGISYTPFIKYQQLNLLNAHF